MLFPVRSALNADANTVAASADYDIVIVGTGISGAIIAKQAAEAGKRVLILEAGTGANRTLAGYNDLLTTFYLAAGKDNQSPFPLNANAAIPAARSFESCRRGKPIARRTSFNPALMSVIRHIPEFSAERRCTGRRKRRACFARISRHAPFSARGWTGH